MMYLVLLTGGLASGKGTVRAQLERLGALSLDLDALARHEQEAPAILQALRDSFGADILDGDGKLKRGLLAKRAFADRESTEKLNAICWPPVVERLEQILGEIAVSNDNRLVVIEVPLLVESGALLDRTQEVLTIAAPEELRLKRAIDRGMNPDDARRRLAQQATDDARAAISDTIFFNDGSLADLESQVSTWYEQRRGEGAF
ncbi:MAG: dephospho-CoA kinase [Coriobacteriales bacterium]|jgi:dephospho-CoA kinase|nr:dephospho-CoA kinase [Coriobacteriales bacterium]